MSSSLILSPPYINQHSTKSWMISTLSRNPDLGLNAQFTSNGLLDEVDQVDQVDQVSESEVQERLQREEEEELENRNQSNPKSNPEDQSSFSALSSSQSQSPAKKALDNLARAPSQSNLSHNPTNPNPKPPSRVSIAFNDDAPDFDLDRELEMEEEEQRRDQSSANKKKGASQDQMELDDEELQALLEQEAQQDHSAVPSFSLEKAKGKQKQSSHPVSKQLESNGLLDDDDGYVPPSTAGPQTLPSKSNPSAQVNSFNRTSNGSRSNQSYRSTNSIPEWAREAAGQITTTSDSSSSTPAQSRRGSAQVGSSTSRQPYLYSTPITREQDSIPRFIPAGVINAITFEGETIMFERRKRLKGWKPPAPTYGDGVTGLLSRPIHQLMDSIDAAAALAVVERDEAARQPKPTTSRKPPADATLWVDRYRPKKFADLLGDERVHREVLGWLKEWDPCVFKRRNNASKRSRGSNVPDVNPSGGYGDKPIWKDPYGRPSERVLMLSGPPGLGKTTLAHVLAAQAGYGVFELNASDARTASAVEDQVRMALESSSMKEAKPTLVVVDEIDGATGGEGGGGGFIRALVKLIEGGKGWKGSKGKGGKRGRKGGKPLLRPIICICNDLYAPALRPLRPLARLVRFTKPATNLLVHRLRDICEKESLGADSRSLNLLAELTGNDIRSCLNALQFAKNRALNSQPSASSSKSSTINLTQEDIKAGSGIKDGGTSSNKVWELLFRKPGLKQVARGGLPKDAAELNRYIVHQGFICGEYEKLAQGCFEHYPTLNTSDDGWWRYEQALDWLHFGSCLSQTVYTLGTSEMLGYVPWSFVPWHGLFANTGNSLPEYPRADYENYLKRQAFDEIVGSLHSILPPNLKILFNRQTVSTELGPALMRLLTPDIKPVSAQAVRTSDRSQLDSLVALMMHLKISFVQDRNEAGSLIFRLEPALDAFTQYEGRGSREIGPTRHAVRALVSRELEAARLRLSKGSGSGSGSGEIDLGGHTAGKAMAVYRKKDGKGANDLNDMAASASASSKVVNGKKGAAGPSLDFFGRVVKEKEVEKRRDPADSLTHDPEGARDHPFAGDPPTVDDNDSLPDQGQAEAEEPVLKKVKVFYRHHEGSSNAVRRPVKLNSLL